MTAMARKALACGCGRLVLHGEAPMSGSGFATQRHADWLMRANGVQCDGPSEVREKLAKL
jgi:hypothetical protein